MSGIRVLSLYLDHPKVGCGWRQFLVIKEGSKWAEVLCIETVEKIKLPMAEIKHGLPVEFRPRRLAKRLRHTALTYHREDSWALKVATKLLASMPAAKVAA